LPILGVLESEPLELALNLARRPHSLSLLLAWVRHVQVALLQPQSLFSLVLDKESPKVSLGANPSPSLLVFLSLGKEGKTHVTLVALCWRTALGPLTSFTIRSIKVSPRPPLFSIYTSDQFKA
jgi:hypothetical protein